MQRILTLFVAIGLLSTSCSNMENKKNADDSQQNNIKYPTALKGDVVDNYFGTEVADPYRWLEDDNSEETGKWVDAENDVTNAYLDKIPFRTAMRERLEKLWNYPKIGVPFKKGDFWYFYKNNGLQNQSVLYRMATLEDEPEEFINPNTFSEDGTTSLSGISFSKDGKYCAYLTSIGGSDWNEIFVIDAITKEKLSDHIKYVKFSGVNWFKDGFYYGRFPAPKEGDDLKGKNINQMVYYHKIGDKQNTDQLIHQDKENPGRMYSISASKDENFLVLSGSDPDSRGNSLLYKRSDATDWIIITEEFSNRVGLVGNIGDTLFIQTNVDAPNNKITYVNAGETEQHLLIAEKEDVMQGVSLKGKYLIAYYLHNASSQAFVYNADGTIKHEVKLPGIGSLSGIGGDEETMTLFYSFSSFTTPSLSYTYDIENNTSELFRKSELDFDMDNYETKQIWYTSTDGTKVPMFVVHKKGLKMDGKNPCMLYGYGGFNISLPPGFSVDRLLWLEQGGIYVQANLRGGGEFGEKWHEAGTKLNKQNVFNDFITAAEYLIENKYTSSEYLAISGRSNGGLLVGATMAQRPQLFKVAFPGVGVMDMLRYHKFTIGYYWANDYGTSDDSVQFNNLIKYSPVHVLKDGECYPSTLIVTADHDDRVFPAHSFKFAARLQEANGCDNPMLIRIDKNAGHGAGKPTAMVIQDKVDMWSYALYEMGLEAKY